MDIVTEENFRGVMLFCDGCECAWHIRCIHRSHRPTEAPAGDWFCTSCESNFHEAAHEELPEVRALTHTHAPSPTHDRTHTFADAPCYWELHWHATRCWCRKNHWRWALSRACRFEMPRCYGITGKSQSHLAFDLRLTRTVWGRSRDPLSRVIHTHTRTRAYARIRIRAYTHTHTQDKYLGLQSLWLLAWVFKRPFVIFGVNNAVVASPSDIREYDGCSVVGTTGAYLHHTHAHTHKHAHTAA